MTCGRILNSNSQSQSELTHSYHIANTDLEKFSVGEIKNIQWDKRDRLGINFCTILFKRIL